MDQSTEAKTEMVFFRVGPTLHRRIVAAADQDNRDKSDFLRLLVEDYLNRWEKMQAALQPARQALMESPR